MLKYYVSWLPVRLAARVICVNVIEFQLFASFLGLLLSFVPIFIFFKMACLHSYLLVAYFLQLSSSYCLLQPCVPACCSLLLAKFFSFLQFTYLTFKLIISYHLQYAINSFDFYYNNPSIYCSAFCAV